MQVLMWFVNALIVFFIAFALMRVMGKRAVAEMSAFDLIVVILLGSMLATPLSSQRSVTQTVVTGAFVALVYFAFSFLMLNNTARQALHAKPTVLISKGNINETGLRQARMTIPELLGYLRVKGYSTVADVEFAILEEMGEISVIPKSQNAPVTPKDLNIATAPASLPVPIIVEGEWLDDNLSYLQKSREWALDQLAMQAFDPEDAKKLSLVQVEPDGTLTIDINEPAFQGQFPPGQYMSSEQASTAVMPSAATNPGISEVTKNALNKMQTKKQAEEQKEK
ncbi:DUF421 domain-containing protein [Effusibacillus consociatus]|uniref:DUF421 domain-containing protein n=1 Tax=Effusibacillus consociatus TaxID=1117041 RepID=A0ABV9Q4U3_9BACL